MKKFVHRIAIILAGAACMAPGCDRDALDDSTFRLWCDDSLCKWRTDAGSVLRVPTWHPNDYGVELVGVPTQISQDTSEGAECMEFSAVANVEASALATIRIDWDFDGVADFEAPIGESNWRPVKTLIHAPEGFGASLRFSLRKDGPGRAALAEIRLQRLGSCEGPRVEMKARALGDLCTAAAQCASGVCTLVCSQCDDTHACAGGASCARRTDMTAPYTFQLPLQCAPQTSAGAAGDPCITGDDCAAHACDGAIVRRDASCADAAASCPIASVRSGRCR